MADPEKALTVVFEPVAEEIIISPGDYVVVEWTGDGMGEIWPRADYLHVGSPMGGDMRAWGSDGTEIRIF
jgi:hypothetical protein